MLYILSATMPWASVGPHISFSMTPETGCRLSFNLQTRPEACPNQCLIDSWKKERSNFLHPENFPQTKWAAAEASKELKKKKEEEKKKK